MSTTTTAGHHSGADHDVVEVTAVDFSFEDLPERIPAGTQLARSTSPAGT